MNSLKWFVQWNPELCCWEVMLGDFRGYWNSDFYLATQERDKLNEIKETENENL